MYHLILQFLRRANICDDIITPSTVPYITWLSTRIDIFGSVGHIEMNSMTRGQQQWVDIDIILRQIANAGMPMPISLSIPALMKCWLRL